MTLSLNNSDNLTSTKLDTLGIDRYGLAIALLIIVLWASSLVTLLCTVDIDRVPLGLKVLAMAVQTFLYTGLFITAHDAMHGSILKKNPHLNALIGAFALMVYGLFSYDKLLKAHWQHHHHPTTDLDPDFHDGKSTGAVAWYIYFMIRYWSWWRLIGLIAAYHVMHRLFHIAEGNLVIFWIIPSLLSSVQLFYFGTFLPHRLPKEGYSDRFCTQSIYRPLWWSFLTCYHFGYHHEHHMYPELAWWQLPAIAKITNKLSH
jgi:beta-carotene/zeaxanthin 4-ketolase